MTRDTIMSLATAAAKRMDYETLVSPSAVPTLLNSFGGTGGITKRDATNIVIAESRGRLRD